MKKYIRAYILIGLIILFGFLLPIFINLYIDYLWFDHLAYASVFLTRIATQVGIVLAVALVLFLGLFANIRIAAVPIKEHHQRRKKPSFLQLFPVKYQLLLSGAIAMMIALPYRSAWPNVLKYLYQTPFTLVDPIFSKDLGFYIFSLPFYMLVVKFLLFSLIIVFIITALVYALNKQLISVQREKVQPISPVGAEVQPTAPSSDQFEIGLKASRKVKLHLSFLGSLFFIILAVWYYLRRYMILTSKQGIVAGAGYTDVHVTLPVLGFFIGFSVVVALILFAWPNVFKKKGTIPLLLVAFVSVMILGQLALPGLVQYLKVLPNEIVLEKPYLEYNIQFTRQAYGLDKVQEFPYSAEPTFTPALLEENSETINNIRLWDHRPLKQTYNQLQEIRLYYDFYDVDTDRYNVNGTYTQVTLSARELNQEQLPRAAKTWVNQRFIYTHGYGVTLNPVNKFDEEGLPLFYIKDIPPKTTVPSESLTITRPEIYYGEKTDQPVVVNTNMKEFDYPKGDVNQYTTYAGTGGVPIVSFWRKLGLAFNFRDIKLLFSKNILPESKIMFNRNIHKRVRLIAPFLTYDQDPYSVIANGKIYWIQDAYTTSNQYPYSESFNELNYIRNSVKVVIDAYNGKVTYYIIDKDDPLIQTFHAIFPDLFKDIDTMPAALKQHIRYPEDLFKIQSVMYGIYHMQDPVVFYNKEDAWDIPTEIYGEGLEIRMEPYYIIMKLPDDEEAEFILMTPFTPLGKANMIGWMAAKSDKDYGALVVYKFPKESLIYGPLQIEARIDQDARISEQITLWDQRGSNVIRGNLLVIPIDHSILYIEPLYLIAEKAQLPELTRVIVSYGGKVVMEKDLATALQRLFKPEVPEKRVVDLVPKPPEKIIDQAIEHYEQLQKAMREGSWVSIGQALEDLQRVLKTMKEQAAEEKVR